MQKERRTSHPFLSKKPEDVKKPRRSEGSEHRRRSEVDYEDRVTKPNSKKSVIRHTKEAGEGARGDEMSGGAKAHTKLLSDDKSGTKLHRRGSSTRQKQNEDKLPETKASKKLNDNEEIANHGGSEKPRKSHRNKSENDGQDNNTGIGESKLKKRHRPQKHGEAQENKRGSHHAQIRMKNESFIEHITLLDRERFNSEGYTEREGQKGDCKPRSDLAESAVLQSSKNQISKDIPNGSKTVAASPLEEMPSLPCPGKDYKEDEYAEDFEDYASDFDDPGSSGISTKSIRGSPVTVLLQPSGRQSPAKDQSLPLGQWFVVSSHKNNNEGDGSHEYSSIPASGLIDFGQSFRRSRRVTQQRIQQRATELLRLIDLDFDGNDHVFEMKPLDEYANYMVRFGQANCNQAQAQTQDDAIDREVQTEPVEVCPEGGLWTQCPSLDSGECFGYECVRASGNVEDTMYSNGSVNNEFASFLDELMAEFTQTGDKGNSAAAPFSLSDPLPDSLLPRLRSVLCMLDEEFLPSLLNKPTEQFTSAADSSVAHRLFQIETESCGEESEQPSILGDSECVACAFAPSNGDALLTIHRPNKVSHQDHLNDRCGFVQPAGELIYVWSISGGNGQPIHQLYCPGLSETGLNGASIICATFSPDAGASMVIGGLADGSICLWDLRDAQQDQEGSGRSLQPDTTIEQPCGVMSDAIPPVYSTSGIEIQHLALSKTSEVKQDPDNSNIGCWSQHHCAPVISIQLLAQNSPGKQSAGRNFQFAALDTFGSLSLWMVLTPSRTNMRSLYELLSGSQIDLGLRPCQYVAQLICLVYLDVRIPSLEIMSAPKVKVAENDEAEDNKSAGDMKELRRRNTAATSLVVTDRGNFLIGFNDGLLVQQGRSATQAIYPRYFYQPENRSAILCMAGHPEGSLSIVVVGYADGIIRLYNTHHAKPLYQWDIAQHRTSLCGAVKLVWCSSRPAIFFCLDAHGFVSTWDLLNSTNRQQVCRGKTPSTASKLTEQTSADSPSSSRVYDFSISQGVMLNVDGKARPSTALALIYSDAVKINWLEPDWSDRTAEELPSVKTCLEELISSS
ncbi:unnamed protein product [Calicophoron daubneyi]|uniref:WD repeat-containing protein 60 n=1 Tax=Calicophoron daubneyi TaxID=300641 RepID=A0AAV2TFN2_CALDB